MDTLETALTVPDLWQQKAVNLLRAEHDVIVDAPTGAGKSFIFEHLVERAFPGKAVFTVPTRALANDKLREWQDKGWRVGIETGDLAYQTDAPIIVATLETQKRALMTGRGPRLLVIDEYQMVGDPARGVNYELALAMAPPETQLLLLSGSVANPREVEAWLLRLQREGNVDWPSLLTVIQTALDAGKEPLEATRELTARLFAREPIRLGLDDFLHQRRSSHPSAAPSIDEQALSGGVVTDFCNSEGVWERKRAPIVFKLKDTWFHDGERWRPGLSSPKIVASLRLGTLCKFGSGKDRRYGLEVPLATFPESTEENRLTLSKWLRKALREQARTHQKAPNVAKLWGLNAIEKRIVPQLPQLTRGGQSTGLTERNGTLYARLDYSEGEIYALKDLTGKGLLNPSSVRQGSQGNFI